MRILSVLILFNCLLINMAFADEMSELKEQINSLTQAVQGLKSTVESQQKEINSLKGVQSEKPQASAALPAPKPATQARIIPGRFTPEIGVVADIVAESANHGLDKEYVNRVNVREVELVLGSNVDPYSRLDATVAFTEEHEVHLEEAYLTRFDLPFRTTARVGRFMPKIGKAVPIHRDSLDTVDEPFVIQRYFGEEGLHKSGVDLTKILNLPSPSAHQVTVGVLEGGNGEGGTAFGGAKWRPTIYGHLKNYFDINDSTNLEVGLSDAAGSNDKNNNFRVNVLGLDGTLRRIIDPNREIKAQGEVFYLHRKDDPVGEISEDTGEFIATTDPGGNFWGGYGLFDVRLSQLWGTGFRFDCVQPVDRLLANPNKTELGYTGYLTFYQSEFARWRVQFSHIDRTTGAGDNRVYIQGTFAIGEHKHKLQ